MLLRAAEALAGADVADPVRMRRRIAFQKGDGVLPVVRQDQLPVIAVLSQDRIDLRACEFGAFIGRQ